MLIATKKACVRTICSSRSNLRVSSFNRTVITRLLSTEAVHEPNKPANPVRANGKAFLSGSRVALAGLPRRTPGSKVDPEIDELMKNAEGKERDRIERLRKLQAEEDAKEPWSLRRRLAFSMKYGQGSLIALTVVAIFGMSSSYRAMEMQKDLQTEKAEHTTQISDLKRRIERQDKARADILAALTAFEGKDSSGKAGDGKFLSNGIKQAYGLVQPEKESQDSFKGII